MTTDQKQGTPKIRLNGARCTGLGICESFAPDHFMVNDDGDLEILEESVDTAALAEVEQAVSGCPTEALRLER